MKHICSGRSARGEICEKKYVRYSSLSVARVRSVVRERVMMAARVAAVSSCSPVKMLGGHGSGMEWDV